MVLAGFFRGCQMQDYEKVKEELSGVAVLIQDSSNQIMNWAWRL